MGKKMKANKNQMKPRNNNSQDDYEADVKEIGTQREEANAPQQEKPRQEEANAPQQEKPRQEATDVESTPTVTSKQSTKNSSGGSKRSVCAMYKVVMKKAQGQKFQVQYNHIGIPVGDTRHTLQSYIGMLARTMVPIDIPRWPAVPEELKQKIWDDIEDTFKVPPELRKTCLQSAGVKWRQFKTTLTTEHVIPFKGQSTKLLKPPKEYAYVGKEAWKRFVAERMKPEWQEINARQSERVRKRKYPHRMSKKGYIGLQEEEVSSGRMDPEEKPDRAILWKKARKSKDPQAVVDEELQKIFEQIDYYIEKKTKGEFTPCGSSDVLSAALQMPEHTGRVRGVGSFVTPTVYFNLPKGGKNRVTKDELLARDKRREEEYNKRTEEFEKKQENLMAEIAQLKTLIGASNLNSSPILSDKASYRGAPEQQLDVDDAMKVKPKPAAAKDLMADEGAKDCFAVDPIDPPPPPEKKGQRKCELAFGSIDNVVAFGIVFEEEDMSKLVHGVPLKPGHARVSVDGCIKADALVPVPVPGEIEKVQEAVGSVLAWPRDLIIYTPTVPIPVERKRRGKEGKGELQRMQALFNKVKLDGNVPERYKMLYKQACCFMKETGTSIPISCGLGLFGIERRIYLLHEEIIALSRFEMIGQAIISAYMSYLHTVVADKKCLELYGFIDPSIYKLNDEFETYLVQRLTDGALRIHFMPFNQHMHWILVVIWESEIYILNPLPHPTRFIDLEKALMGAVRTYNARNGRVHKKPKVINLAGCPKQPGGTECGYAVMRYMKDIVEDKDMKFFQAWLNKSRKCYEVEDLDVVRMEALGYIERFI